MRKRFGNQVGFTLIEMLIVIIILGILAAVIIPQVTVSTEDAKLSTLKTNLSHMRSTIEIYYAQHDNTYPGANDVAGAGTSIPGTAQTAFLQQLTRYTEKDGTVSDTKSTAAKFGPYIKGGKLPGNPFNDKNDVLCDATEPDITQRVSNSTTAWKFYTQTGVLIANDGGHDTE